MCGDLMKSEEEYRYVVKFSISGVIPANTGIPGFTRVEVSDLLEREFSLAIQSAIDGFSASMHGIQTHIDVKRMLIQPDNVLPIAQKP